MRRVFGLAGVLLAIIGPSLAAQTSATQLLVQAKDALDNMSVAGADENTRAWVRILKRDFADLQSAYAAQTPPEKSETGSTVAETPNDLQFRYAALASDLISVSDDTSLASSGLKDFKAILAQFRRQVGKAVDPFGVTDTPAPAPIASAMAPQNGMAEPSGVSAPACEPVSAGATAVLDRLQHELDQAMATIGGDLSVAGKVLVPGKTLAELRADLLKAGTYVFDTSARPTTSASAVSPCASFDSNAKVIVGRMEAVLGSGSDVKAAGPTKAAGAVAFQRAAIDEFQAALSELRTVAKR